MDFTIIILACAAAVIGWMYTSQRKVASRELVRLRGEELDFLGGLSKQFNAAAAALAEKTKKKSSSGLSGLEAREQGSKKLRDAGLETAQAQGKYYLCKTLCAVIGPVAGAVSYLYFIPYYATIFTLFTSALGIALPMLWLRARTAERTEDIQRELPLVLDLVNLTTSAGWDVASGIERVADALFAEFPEHPLIRELKRARWLVASGYTWEEALNYIAARLGDDTVSRTTLALGQAIRQGGDRSIQLEGIAQDAQRMYSTALDKRLAALPVKALLVTMGLMIAYFVLILSPAVVQIKDILHGVHF